MKNKKEVEAHETEDGYCCACSYDIACMNEKIEIAVQRKVEEIIEIIDKEAKGYSDLKTNAGDENYGALRSLIDVIEENPKPKIIKN